VVDVLGRSVQISQKPTQIVTTHPTATETLYGVDGLAVGRDTGSKYPPEAQSIATIGSPYGLNMEAIVSMNPDLVIIEALTQSRLIPDFEKLGISVIAVRAASLDDINQALILIGKVVDSNQAAVEAVNDIQNTIETAKNITRTGRNVLILISDADRNVYAAKPESYPGTLVALLGQGNLATGMPESGPYPGFTLYSGEKALTSNPDVVFTISPAPSPAPRLSDILARVPGFNQMGAVISGKVKELDPALFLQAQGPRIADAVEELTHLLNEVAP
jgi:iron complex transport system substrate-binding protein